MLVVCVYVYVCIFMCLHKFIQLCCIVTFRCFFLDCVNYVNAVQQNAIDIFCLRCRHGNVYVRA